MKLRTLGLMLTLGAGTANARLSRSWTYAELSTKADLVIIAESMKPTDTDKHEALPDISRDGGKMMAPCAASERKVVTVLKGKAGASVTVQHDALVNAQAMVDGPGLLTFDPNSHKQFLMFLTKHMDEYVSMSGPSEPLSSVEELHLLSN